MKVKREIYEQSKYMGIQGNRWNQLSGEYLYGGCGGGGIWGGSNIILGRGRQALVSWFIHAFFFWSFDLYTP